MKTKNILKSTLAVVAVTASSFGAWKAYEAYRSVDNSLLMENLEALTHDDSDTGENMIWVRNKSGKCWVAHFEEIKVGSHSAIEVTWKKGNRWHSCISIPMEQYIEQNKTRSPTWTKCQADDTGKCKYNERQQEKQPDTEIYQIN